MLQALRTRFLENPLIGKELATGLTSPRLGAVFTLVTVVYLATDLLCYLLFFLSDSSDFSSLNVQAGAILHGAHGVVAYGVLTLLLPLRLAGHIEGPRAGRAFDQVVVTGVSPVRMCLGNWMLGLCYAATLLMVTVPFDVMAYVFGGVTAGQILSCYAVLLLYSNVIIAVTLGLSVMTSEWLVMPLTIAVFAIVGIVSFVPGTPSVIAEVGPLRFILGQALSTGLLAGSLPPFIVEHLQDPPHFFFIDVPSVIYRPLLWACLLMPFVMLMTLGPSHFFLPGFNVFGSVVLPGDSRRSRLRRLRHGLVRRIEMAFYYENRPAWCDRWDFPLRTLVGILVVVLLWGAIFGVIYQTFRIPSTLEGDEYFHVSFVLAGVVLFFWMLAVGQTRLWTLFREKVGRLELTRGAILNASFFVLFVALFAIESASFRILEDVQSAGLPLARADAVFETYFADRRAYVGICMALFLNIYLLSRVLAWVFLNAGTWRLWVFFTTNVLLWGPIVIHAMARRSVLHLFPPSFESAVYLSPYAILELREEPLWLRFQYGMVAHACLGAVLAAIGFGLWWWLREGARWPSMPSRQTRPIEYGDSAPDAPAEKSGPPPLSRADETGGGARGASAILILGLAVLCSGPAGAQPLPGPGAPLEAVAVLDAPGGWSVEGDLPVDVVEIARGFDGRIFSPMIDFLTIVLESRSAETLTGRLRLRAGRDQDVWQAFELPTRTRVPVRLSLTSRRWWSHQELLLELESERGRLLVDGIAPAISVGQTAPPARVEEGGRFLIVSDVPGRPLEWQRGTTGGSVVHIVCRPLALPEDWLSYAETSTVLLGSPDFSRLTQRQRQALYDYMRLGGAVVLFGQVDLRRLQASEPWGSWFEGARLARVEGPGGSFGLIEFAEGAEAVLHLAGGTGEAVPLLTVRGVGFGRLGHLGLDPTAPHLPSDVAASATFWAEFTRRLPKSLHPVAFSPYLRGDNHLNDPGALYLILGYFGLYTLLLGPGLFYWFRQKARRPYMWRYVLSLCGLFAVGVYALDWVVHTQPSRGEIREMVCFGPDSSEGVSYAAVRLRSCGRQRHTLRVTGSRISSFKVVHDRSPAFVPGEWIQPPALDGSYREIPLVLAPWSGLSVSLVGETKFRSGVRGHATYEPKTQRVDFTIDSQVEPVGGEFVVVTYNLDGKGMLRSHAVRADALPGTFRGTVAAAGGAGSIENQAYRSWSAPGGMPGAVTASTRIFRSSWTSVLRVGGGSGARVLVAWAPAVLQSGLGLSSDDILFRQDGTLDSNGIPLREYREFRRMEDESGPYHLLHQQLIVQEIPLEVR